VFIRGGIPQAKPERTLGPESVLQASKVSSAPREHARTPSLTRIPIPDQSPIPTEILLVPERTPRGAPLRATAPGEAARRLCSV
jgi:hypothetical protein